MASTTAQLSPNLQNFRCCIIVVATRVTVRTNIRVGLELSLIVADVGICHYCVARNQGITTEVILCEYSRHYGGSQLQRR